MHIRRKHGNCGVNTVKLQECSYGEIIRYKFFIRCISRNANKTQRAFEENSNETQTKTERALEENSNETQTKTERALEENSNETQTKTERALEENSNETRTKLKQKLREHRLSSVSLAGWPLPLLTLR
eukprot:1182619-Prorocentrum_minimum.AAC.1